MRIVDTSAWIEWLAATPTGEALTAGIPPLSEWVVPTIVHLELAKWLNREAGEDRADQIAAFTDGCIIVPLDTRIAFEAALLCARHRLATADAIVYATALLQGADLLTCDAHFNGLPNVRFVSKEGR